MRLVLLIMFFAIYGVVYVQLTPSSLGDERVIL